MFSDIRTHDLRLGVCGGGGGGSWESENLVSRLSVGPKRNTLLTHEGPDGDPRDARSAFLSHPSFHFFSPDGRSRGESKQKREGGFVTGSFHHELHWHSMINGAFRD